MKKTIPEILILLYISSIGISCDGETQTRLTMESAAVGVAADVIRVGPGERFTTSSAAAAHVRDGDVVEIMPGLYSGDVVVWRQNNLLIRGIDKPHIEANGAHVEGKGTWLIKGENTIIQGIEFSGAAVPDGNGAAIRLEGTNLTLLDCYIHHNENGFLCGENASSQVVFENCEFAYNGVGDGYTHNMYIGPIGRFILKCSYVHHAIIGHNVKSRAKESYILYNRIMDEQSGNSSYALDVPNGGLIYVIGNSMQQGVNTDNSTMLAYGAEGQTHVTNEIYVINNTFVNDFDGGLFIGIFSSPTLVWIMNNLLVGPGENAAQDAMLSNNIFSNDPGFVDRSAFDYHLVSGSPMINAGVELGKARDFNLTPVLQYDHPAHCMARFSIQEPDVGAYEYGVISSVP